MRRNQWCMVLMATLMCAFPVNAAIAKTVLEVVVTDIPSGWTAGGQAAYNQVKADFEKANPDIQVELQFRSWGQPYLDYLIASAAAGTMPDVLQIGGNHQGPLGKAGLLLHLDDYIKRWGQFNDFPPGVREDVTMNGHIVGLPYRADVRLLMYNKGDFDDAGLNREAAPQTWEDIISLGKKLTQRDNNGQMLRSGFRWYGSEFYSPVWQAGGDFIVEVNGKPQVTIDSAASREGLDFVQKLVSEYQVTPSASKSASGKSWGMEYGTASIEVRPEGHIRKLRDEAGIDLGIGPAIRHKEAAELVFINKWAISKQSTDTNAAWKWLEYVSQSEVVSQIQFATAGLPPRRSVAQLDPWARDANYRAVFNAMAYVRPLPGAKYASAAEIRSALTNALKGITAGTMSVPAAIEQAKQTIAGYLAKE